MQQKILSCLGNTLQMLRMKMVCMRFILASTEENHTHEDEGMNGSMDGWMDGETERREMKGSREKTK